MVTLVPDINVTNFSQLVTDGTSTAFDVIPAALCSTPMRTSSSSATDPSSATIVHTAAARVGTRSKISLS
jgi:hypothetical protein